jgi:hypothetical protein
MLAALARLKWLAIGVVLGALALELLLRCLPVSMGMHRTLQYERWPLNNTQPHRRFTYSLGWSMQNARSATTNNYGQVAPFDFRPGRHPVVVIGDSYVEAMMNDYADTLQGQLAARIGVPDAVYGLGVSGLSASDYVALSRQARDEFAPAAAVFVITDGDLAESLQPRVGSYYLVPGAGALQLRYEPMKGDTLPTKIRQVTGDIALHRYFQANLQFSLDPLLARLRPAALLGALPSASATSAAPNRGPDVAEQKQVVDWMLETLPSSLGLPPACIVLLLDSDRYAIYRPDSASPRKDSADARQHLIDRARSLGFNVTDLDPVFRQRHARDRAKFDHWPIDRHWNRLGHGIAADEAYRFLFEPGAPGAAACTVSRRDPSASR